MRSVTRLGVTVLTALAALAALAVPASAARPLPGVSVRQPKPIVGTVDITYVPGAGIRVTPGGDIATGFACATTPQSTTTVVDCYRTSDALFDYECSALDIDTVGLFAVAAVPPMDAWAQCADDSGGRLAHLDTRQALRAHEAFNTIVTTHVGCSAKYAETVTTAWDIRCAYSFSLRQPIVGGVTMTQQSIGGALTWSTWGVLSNPTDWTCVLVQPSPLAGAPYVDCNRAATSAYQWFCDNVVVTATVSPTLPNAPLPQVRGQASCDGNTAVPATPHVPGLSLSTYDVPMVSGTAIDTYSATLGYDTARFVCQAWGPLNTFVPIAPWTVECDEP